MRHFRNGLGIDRDNIHKFVTCPMRDTTTISGQSRITDTSLQKGIDRDNVHTFVTCPLRDTIFLSTILAVNHESQNEQNHG